MMAKSRRCPSWLMFRVLCWRAAGLVMAILLPVCLSAQSGDSASFQDLAQLPTRRVRLVRLHRALSCTGKRWRKNPSGSPSARSSSARRAAAIAATPGPATLGLALLRVPLLPSQVDPLRDALLHEAGDVAAAVDRRQFDEAGNRFRNLAANYPGTSFLHYAWGGFCGTVAPNFASLVDARYAVLAMRTLFSASPSSRF